MLLRIGAKCIRAGMPAALQRASINVPFVLHCPYTQAQTADKRLLVLPGQFNGFHGWMDLTQASGAFSTTATKVADFIAAHTSG
jgi:hypothetical protein